MFHGIEKPGYYLHQEEEDAFYTVPEQEFSSCLDMVVDKDYLTLTSDDINRVKYENKKKIILTFDDGWESDYEIAYPLLKKYNMKAIFFVVAEWIGKKKYISKNQLVEMSKNGMDIQSHGATHRFLSQLPEQEIRNELYLSKQIIENILGKEVTSLSYPGGRGNKKVREIGKELGYKLFFSSKPGWYALDDEEISRLVVHSKTDDEKLNDYFSFNLITHYQQMAKYYLGRSIVSAVGKNNYNAIKNTIKQYI